MSKVSLMEKVEWLNKVIPRVAEVVNNMAIVAEGLRKDKIPEWRKLPSREYTEAALKRIKEQYPQTSNNAVQASGGKVKKPYTRSDAINQIQETFNAEINDKPKGAPF